jgi:two-component system, cell cycle sensor histidine kinase and response regulator CckA
MTPDPLRILFIEDAPQDVELEERELRRAGLEFESCRVETREALRVALGDFKPDLIISDFSLPQLDGLSALRIVRDQSSDLPFIFVSGTIGEERAIESLKNGATDYVVKDHLASLVVKVNRALREAQERVDRRRAEDNLRQAQKMEAVGRLAGGIAHDFNNLLTVINGYTELMLVGFPADHPLRGNAEEVLKAGNRAASLTRQLLAFSRKQVLAPAVLNLNGVVSHVERMLRRLIGEDIELIVSPGPALWNVRADPGQMEQVLLNLCVNARDAMPRGGTLILETANVSLDEHYTHEHPGATVGPHVLLAVTDTGIGMGPETLAHLFEPFFTTKDPGKGTGLGLSTVYGIVRQSGGSVWVDSAPGQGTTFKVYLPQVDQALTAAPPSPVIDISRRGAETILLVEDSESVRKLMSSVLTHHGYRVLVAEDGDQALRTIGASQDILHLLIADVVLPKMSGAEVAYLVTRARPGTKVLFTSGYTERGAVENGILESGMAFLPKPFSPDALARKVREVLDTPG